VGKGRNRYPRLVLHAVALALIAGALCAGLGGRAAVWAQGRGWSKPFFVSPDTKSSWFPDLASAPDGSVHIVWASSRSVGPELKDTLDLLYYRSLRGGAWSEPNNISNPGVGGFATRNSIVAGPDGALNLLIRGQTTISFLRAPQLSAGQFLAWSEPRKINNLSTPYYTALALDGGGTLHALWAETVPDDAKSPRKECANCADVFYRASGDGGRTWTEPLNLSNSVEGSMKPQIKVDDRNGLHAVWEEGVDTIVARGKPVAGAYRHSPDGGKTWGPVVRFTLPVSSDLDEKGKPKPDAPRQIALGLYQNRTPVVVYRSAVNNRVYFQTSQDGAAWGEPRALPGVLARDLNDTPWDGYALATDSAGALHLVMVGFPAGAKIARPVVLHLTWNGKSWSAPDVVASSENYPDWTSEGLKQCTPPQNQSEEELGEPPSACQKVQRYPEWPRIAVGLGNQLEVAWFTRNVKDRYTSDYAEYQVWYSARQIDAPAVAPVAPPPTATPPPTPAPTATLVPTPMPTLSAQAASAPLLEERLAWEGPGMLAVGLSALPALGFVALVVGVARLRARR
jgi:hypothetical protein